MDQVRQIAEAVLYEGYLLWPYRRSALKNQQRWTFGGVYPRDYATARGADDPWLMQTQCLIEAAPTATVDVRVRFLHVVTRDVGRLRGEGFEPAPELTVGGARYLGGEETTERQVAAVGLTLGDVLGRPHKISIDIPAGQDIERLGDPASRPAGAAKRAAGVRHGAGAVRRGWQALRGRVEIRAEHLPGELFRITVRIINTNPWCGDSRAEALKRTFVSAHTVLQADGGRFVSLTDPPDALRALAADCRNIGAWPVLVGAQGDRHTVLSAPIILYDYPQVAPESPGDLFDATEIDQLLTLSILALTEEEQREMRDGDPRAREILDRCNALSPEQLMRLHGTLRDVPSSPSASSSRASSSRAPSSRASDGRPA